jgi:hypothetical protein
MTRHLGIFEIICLKIKVRREKTVRRRKINIYVPPLNTCAGTLARAC